MLKLHEAELISNNLESFLINILVNLFPIINTFKLGSVLSLQIRRSNCIMNTPG